MTALGGDPQGYRQRRLHHHLRPGRRQGHEDEPPGDRRGAAGAHGPGGQLFCLRGDRRPRLSELPPGASSWYRRCSGRCGERGRGLRPQRYRQGQRIMVEFVSANPTGPMHMGNARGGVLGDTLASVLLKLPALTCGGSSTSTTPATRSTSLPESLEARYLQIIRGRGRRAVPGGRLPRRRHQGAGPGCSMSSTASSIWTADAGGAAARRSGQVRPGSRTSPR